MATETIKSAVNQAAPNGIKDTAIRALKTFVGVAAGANLTVALFGLDVSGAKSIAISAGSAAVNVVMNALLKWAATE